MQEDLRSLVSDIVERARRYGADQADAYVHSGIESSVTVRKQETERLFEAASRSVSIRVIKQKRTAVCNTSDLTPKALDEMVRTAVELASISEPDEYAGLPAKEDLALDEGVGLQLYDERLESLTVDDMRDIVLRAEQAAFDFDPRITNSEGAEFGAERGEVVLANTLGFCRGFPYTAASFAVSVLADEPDGKKQSDSWFSMDRAFHRLLSPEEVGRRAASRVLRKLGGRKVATREVPVVWEPTVAVRLLSLVGGAVSGEALFKRSTFLTDREGERIGSPLVTITDDPTLPGRLGTRPFDGEGVARRVNPLFEGGVFRQFLFDSYYARRLGRRTTGSAARSGDTIGIGTSNLVWQAGEANPDDLIASVDDGLYLTELMGFGFNPTTGDLSKGAAGVWIEHGQLAYPVVEINVSGNLGQMLADIDGAGNDLQWLGAAAAPTLRMAKLMVSGL
jgi:PmbA protein